MLNEAHAPDRPARGIRERECLCGERVIVPTDSQDAVCARCRSLKAVRRDGPDRLTRSAAERERIRSVTRKD
jgi:hypothetical protein